MCELLDEQNATHLRLAGVEEIVSRTNLTAGLFAATVVNAGVTSLMSNILTHHEGSYLRKIQVPEEYAGRPFLEAFDGFKRDLDATIIAIDSVTDSGRYEQQVNPPCDQELATTDKLVVVIKRDSILCELTGTTPKRR